MTKQERLLADKDIVIQRYLAGEGMCKLAKTYQCNNGTVWCFLKNQGVCIRSRKNKGVLESQHNTIVQMYIDGLTAHEIARRTGVKHTSVLNFLKKRGIDTSRDRRRHPGVLAENHKDEIIQLHNSGMGQELIGKKLKLAGSAICRFLQKHGIQAHPQAQYSVDETFFDTIDTEVKAYVLGLFYADGCVDETGKLRISLIDKEMIEQLKEVLKYTGPIYFQHFL